MNSKAWLLLNLALLGTTGVTVTNVVSLPGQIRKEQADLRKIVDKAPEESAEATAKNPSRTAKAAAKKAARSESDVPDTWPDIRRGSLDSMWKKSLFSKNRTEIVASQNGDTLQEGGDELPAPPNFELVGILTLGSSKVAIIELKNSNSSRMGRMGGPGGPGGMRGPRMPMGGPGGPMMPPQQQQPAQGNATASFEPTFITAHENDELRTTGYTLVTINKEENFVILEKSGLQYKLSLDTNNSFAQQRVANQNTFLESQKQKAEAAAKQQQQQQQMQQRNMQANGRSNTPPMPPGMQGGWNRGGMQGGWNRGGMQGGGMQGGWNRGGMQGGGMQGGWNRGGMQGGMQGGWNRGGMQGGTTNQGTPGGFNRGGMSPMGNRTANPPMFRTNNQR